MDGQNQCAKVGLATANQFIDVFNLFMALSIFKIVLIMKTI